MTINDHKTHKTTTFIVKMSNYHYNIIQIQLIYHNTPIHVI